MNVEERLSLVRACIFQDEPTFLEGFHDAVETAVLRRMVLRILLRRSGARKLSEEWTLYGVWMTAFGAKPPFLGLWGQSQPPDCPPRPLSLNPKRTSCTGLRCITKKRACSGRSAIKNRHEHGALRQS
jgi:hypothetical protein